MRKEKQGMQREHPLNMVSEEPGCRNQTRPWRAPTLLDIRLSICAYQTLSDSRMQLLPFILIQSFHLVAKMHQKDVAQLQPVS